jgi:hypothetical protein
MAHPDLRMVLARMVRKVHKDRVPSHRTGIPVKVGRSARRVDVTVLPVPVGDQNQKHCLVVFESSAPERKGAESTTGRARRGSGRGAEPDRAQLLEMQQELAEAKDHLQAVIDQPLGKRRIPEHQ